MRETPGSEIFVSRRLPFADKLIPKKRPYHFGLESYPGKRLRGKISIFKPNGDGADIYVSKDNFDRSSPDALDKTIKRLTAYRQFFAELREDGMRVVDFDYVITESGYDSASAECITITDEIDGLNLNEMNVLNSHAAKEADTAFTGYFNHLKRVIRQGGKYWFDMHPTQIVYGTRTGESQPKAYVVDIDPIVKTWTNESVSGVKDGELEHETDQMASRLMDNYEYIIDLTKKALSNQPFWRALTQLGDTIAAVEKARSVMPDNARDLFAKLKKELPGPEGLSPTA